MPEWLLYLAWFVAGIFATGALWYFLSQRNYHASLWAAYIAVVVALLAVALQIRNDLVRCEEKARSAYTGILQAQQHIVVSGTQHVWPKVEFGDSGAIPMYAGPQGSPLFTFAEDMKLTIVREEGHVKVSTIIRDRTGRVVAELVKNEWRVNPHNSWDRNYTSDALEVRDPTSDIVLQIKVLEDRVQLQAKFHDSGGRGFEFGKVLGPQGWGGGIEITGPAYPQLQMRIAPIFKYPSDSRFGSLLK